MEVIERDKANSKNRRSTCGSHSKEKTAAARGRQIPDRQAPAGAWSPRLLMTALLRGSIDEKVAVLKKAGILDANGKLTKTYKSWGSKVTRTPYARI